MMAGGLARSERLKGARLGAYEIVRVLGHGATSSVFEARHVALGKPVAIKVLHDHLADDEQVTGRFLREGRVAAQLRHPNALDVMDVGEENGVAYLVMDLLDGRDLKAHLAEHGALPVNEAVAYLLPIASALAHAHDLGAVHRDLKPANVFLSEDARGSIVPMLVDFGLSKLDGLDESKPLTESEIVAGSVSYMAPEQTYGVAKAGPAADQFALGNMLYECIVGRVPFAAATFYDLIEQIRASVVKPPSLCIDGLPEELDAVVLRSLARDPEKRWPNMRAFGAALLAFADEQTESAWRSDFVDEARTARVASRPRVIAARSASRETERAAQVETLAATPLTPAPRLPLPAGKGPFHIKGMPYRGIAYLVARVLPRGMLDLADELDDPSLRAFVTQTFLASGRYDILPMLPIHVALARILGLPLAELTRRGATAQARYDARTVFQRLIGPATVDDWPARVQRFGVQYYDFGTFSGIATEPGTFVLQHAGVPEYIYPWYAPMQVAYGAEVGRLLGAVGITQETLPPEPTGTDGGLPIVTVRSRLRWQSRTR